MLVHHLMSIRILKRVSIRQNITECEYVKYGIQVDGKTMKNMSKTGVADFKRKGAAGPYFSDGFSKCIC